MSPPEPTRVPSRWPLAGLQPSAGSGQAGPLRGDKGRMARASRESSEGHSEATACVRDPSLPVTPSPCHQACWRKNWARAGHRTTLSSKGRRGQKEGTPSGHRDNGQPEKRPRTWNPWTAVLSVHREPPDTPQRRHPRFRRAFDAPKAPHTESILLSSMPPLDVLSHKCKV